MVLKIQHKKKRLYLLPMALKAAELCSHTLLHCGWTVCAWIDAICPFWTLEGKCGHEGG